MTTQTIRFPLDGRLRRMFIDGNWAEARSGQTLETSNPATGAVIGHVPRGAAADIDLAVDAAGRAFEGPGPLGFCVVSRDKGSRAGGVARRVG